MLVRHKYSTHSASVCLTGVIHLLIYCCIFSALRLLVVHKEERHPITNLLSATPKGTDSSPSHTNHGQMWQLFESPV